MQAVLANLAEHEFIIGRFYLRYGAPERRGGAVRVPARHLPAVPERDKVLYHLGMAYELNQQPDGSAARLSSGCSTEFPQSPYIQQIPDVKATR